MAVDLEWIVSTARQADPSLDHDVAVVLASAALGQLSAAHDAPELARALLAAHPEHGATAANVVAKATVDLATDGQAS